MGFFAEHLDHCYHADGHITITGDLPASLGSVPCSAPSCGNTEQNWMCAACHVVFCGRSASGHMLEHAEVHGHKVAIGLADLSFWCYGCDSYINHLTIRSVYDLYNRLHQLKFDAPVPVPFGYSANVAGPSGASARGGATAAATLTLDQDSGAGAAAAAPSTTPATVPLEPAETAESFLARLSELARAEASPVDLSDPVVDRMLGCLFGNALGDAFGLCTEFLNKKEVLELHGTDPIDFPAAQQTPHSRRFAPGDWTDDTDQMVLLMDAAIRHGGSLASPEAAQTFASSLLQWILGGFPELGDTAGSGCGATTASVCFSDGFEDDPHAAALETWELSGKRGAPNGAVMRTSALGCLRYRSVDQVTENAVYMARTTHADPRCQASAAAVSALIALLVQHAAANSGAVASAAEMEEITQNARDGSLPILSGAAETAEFVKHMSSDSFTSLNLDEATAIGYTLKCAGCGFVAATTQSSFQEMMQTLVREGGDADTNGAVAGAVWGAKFGFSKLPIDWIAKMPFRTWFVRKALSFVQLAISNPL